MMDWLEKAVKLAARHGRHIKSITLPIWLGGGGIQFEAPPEDTSFGRAQDERELRDELYLQAGIEAYSANDGGRRLRELALSKLQAVEKFLAENPEMRRWFERNLDAGTCAAAVAELRKRREQFRQARLSELGGAPMRQTPNPEFDWLRQAARGM